MIDTNEYLNTIIWFYYSEGDKYIQSTRNSMYHSNIGEYVVEIKDDKILNRLNSLHAEKLLEII